MMNMPICPRCFADSFTGCCASCGYHETPHNSIALRPFTVLRGKYIIGVPLGIGGFGITYMAKDKMSGEKLAIKEYFP